MIWQLLPFSTAILLALPSLASSGREIARRLRARPGDRDAR